MWVIDVHGQWGQHLIVMLKDISPVCVFLLILPQGNCCIFKLW